MELITKIEYSDATIWVNESKQLHRQCGPAVEWASGDKEWYKNDKLHREDGPAITRVNGECEWWIGGLRVSAESHANIKNIKEYAVTDIGNSVLLAVDAWEYQDIH